MGSIRFRCECGKEFSVPDTLAGKKGRCPSCGSIVIIPAVPSAPEGSQQEASPGARPDRVPGDGPTPVIVPSPLASGAAIPHPPPYGAAGAPPTLPYPGHYAPPPGYVPPYVSPGYPPHGFYPAAPPAPPREAEPRPYYVPPSLEVAVWGCIKEAWGVIRDSIGHFVAATAIYLAFVWGLVWLPLYIGWMIFVFLAPPFFAGMHYFCLKKVRGEAARPGDLFRGFKLYGKALGAFLLIHLLAVPAFIPLVVVLSTGGGFLPAHGTGALATLGRIAVSMPVLISIGVVVVCSLAYFFIVDRGMGPLQALVSSWRMVLRARWRVPVVLFLTYSATLVGFALLLVGLCVTVPLSIVSLASVYHRLSLAQYYAAVAGWQGGVTKRQSTEEPPPASLPAPERSRPPRRDRAY